MKRYRFSLETALRVRRVQEEAARFALARANRERQRAVEAYRAALERYQSLEHGAGSLDLASYRCQRDEAERMAASVAKARTTVDTATEVVSAHHAEWLVASRRVAALEHLDERRRAEWLVEEQRAEMATIDESALSRWLTESSAAASAPSRPGAEP